MRKIFTLVAAILLAVTVWAQSGCPQKMSYQAVVRNAANELVTNTTGITVEIMISDGTISYSETHTVSSNQNGLISFMIGQDGTDIQGTMDNLDWANANMTTTVTVPDELPVVTTTEVVAVPYALYACEINPDGVNITKIKTDIYNHIQDTLSNYYTKAETDNKYETKAALCDDVIACVDGKLADGSSTTNNAIDTIVKNNVLTELQDGTSDINHTVDTIVNNQIMKAAADSLISARELKDSLSNYTETSKLCEYITTNCTDIALDSELPTVNNSTITIKQGDSNLGTFTLNQEGATTITIPTPDAQAQADWAQTDNTKADYIKNKPNIEKIVRDSLVNGNSAINHIVDTIANNQIMKAAADSLISARELKDSLSNYTETSKLCEYITTNCTDIALDSEISNKTVTIKAADGTTTVGSFTLNQNTDATITLPASATVNNGILTITDGDANTEEFTANQATNATVTLGKVAFTNNYNDLANKPTIPTVNDATVTIQNNGTNVGTFTLNASSATTVNILDKQYSQQYKATAGQTAFTATIPTGYTSINTDSRLIQLYINGVMVGTNLDGVVTISSNTVSYVKSANDNYELRANDRVQIIYWVK